ncbi:hypothetical protein SAMN04489812_1852 [Microlunatus soli]|uniref:Uncharacterized protein n=1 Tax=Microlunatus soli TaxID=630515 RepID=A0A1H1S400_9ACTN|nr:hypothetical protein SAMN04489812_1852 [Microlunatus soli]
MVPAAMNSAAGPARAAEGRRKCRPAPNRPTSPMDPDATAYRGLPAHLRRLPPDRTAADLARVAASRPDASPPAARRPVARARGWAPVRGRPTGPARSSTRRDSQDPFAAPFAPTCAADSSRVPTSSVSPRIVMFYPGLLRDAQAPSAPHRCRMTCPADAPPPMHHTTHPDAARVRAAWCAAERIVQRTPRSGLNKWLVASAAMCVHGQIAGAKAGRGPSSERDAARVRAAWCAAERIVQRTPRSGLNKWLVASAATCVHGQIAGAKAGRGPSSERDAARVRAAWRAAERIVQPTPRLDVPAPRSPAPRSRTSREG